MSGEHQPWRIRHLRAEPRVRLEQRADVLPEAQRAHEQNVISRGDVGAALPDLGRPRRLSGRADVHAVARRAATRASLQRRRIATTRSRRRRAPHASVPARGSRGEFQRASAPDSAGNRGRAPSPPAPRARAGISNGLWLCTTSCSPASHSTGGHSSRFQRPHQRAHRDLDVGDRRGWHVNGKSRVGPVFPGAGEQRHCSGVVARSITEGFRRVHVRTLRHRSVRAERDGNRSGAAQREEYHGSLSSFGG